MNRTQCDQTACTEPLGSCPTDEFRRVLVVDDDPAVRRLVCRILENAGYEVRQAANGVDAIEAMRQQLPCFVITDWDMPLLDGAEFCRLIRQEKFSNYVYIIMLTGSRTDHLVEGLDSGADDFLTKPFKPLELRARMRAGARILDLEQKLRFLASRDPLTGLLNRRTFFELLDKEWSRAGRSGHAMSCVMVDIDSFKKINDTHGHPVGDAVLKSVARLLEDNCRKGDSVCRYGGEEFCAMLVDTSEEGAARWAERCRRMIAETPFVGDEVNHRVTASFGVAQRSDHTDSIERLLNLADRALLAAKREGKNQVVRFTSLPRLAAAGTAACD